MAKKELLDNHLKMYDETYDDMDRYGDIIHQMYNDIHEFIDEQYLSVLNHDNIGDFHNFLMSKINKSYVDFYNKEQIKQKVIEDWKGISVDASISGPIIDDDFSPEEPIIAGEEVVELEE